MKTRYPALLGVCNMCLLVASTALVYLGGSLIFFYELDKLYFVSVWFMAVPYIMMGLGGATFVHAIYGCALVFRGTRCHLVLFAMLMAVLFGVQLVGVFGAMELRMVIMQKQYIGVDVVPFMKDYLTNDWTRNLWDGLQRQYQCCGAFNFNTGYRIWLNTDIGIARSSVPDSCCLRIMPDCGKDVFLDQELSIMRYVYTHGCLTVMEEKLSRQIVPVLLFYEGLGTVLALLELLAIFFACAYSAAITRLYKREDDLRSLMSSLGVASAGQRESPPAVGHKPVSRTDSPGPDKPPPPPPRPAASSLRMRGATANATSEYDSAEVLNRHAPSHLRAVQVTEEEPLTSPPTQPPPPPPVEVARPPSAPPTEVRPSLFGRSLVPGRRRITWRPTSARGAEAGAASPAEMQPLAENKE